MRNKVVWKRSENYSQRGFKLRSEDLIRQIREEQWQSQKREKEIIE